MRGIFNKFNRSDGGDQGVAEGGARPEPQALRHLESGRDVGRSAFTHPHWDSDRITSGSSPESTRTAMGRQFARVIGETLGKNTNSSNESLQTLKEALSSPITIMGADKYLYAAIEEVSGSKGYDQATRNLAGYMDSALQGMAVSERLALTTALMQETVHRMFSEMLDGPKDMHSRMSVSGDLSMKTVFGIRGEVKEMSMTMIRGHLSHYFQQALSEAQGKYQEKKATLRAGGAIAADQVFEFTLTEKQREQEKTTTFKTTKKDLVTSYRAALLRYASTGYADRVRERQVKALE